MRGNIAVQMDICDKARKDIIQDKMIIGRGTIPCREGTRRHRGIKMECLTPRIISTELLLLSISFSSTTNNCIFITTLLSI